MTRTSAPVHARTWLTIAWERYLPPPTTAVTSQVSPIAAIAPLADTSATPLTTTDRSTRHVVAVTDIAATDALSHPSTEQQD